MASFDYEQLIWGKGEATFNPTDPTAFRFWRSFNWLSNLPFGSKVLEVGTGAGQFIRAFKKRRPDWECFGTDISRSALAQAEETNDSVNYALAEANKLPYEDNYFSAVMIFDVLEHVENPRQLLLEIFRVLQPGGKFYCFIPCEGDKLSFWYWLRNSKKWNGLTEKYAGHINRWSRQAWLDLFGKTGFKIGKINYSEHLSGQILGLLAFYLMDRNSPEGSSVNNEKFFSDLSEQNGWLAYFKKVVNGLVYWESLLGRRLPSPNMHVLLEKK